MKNRSNILLISVYNEISVLGLKYIHYYLLKHGWRSHLLYLPVLDVDNPRALERLRSFVSQMEPIFIGVSLMSVDFSRARDVSGYLKRHFPTVPIVWGGTHPTLRPEDCFPFADYVCIGEGERTALDIANAVSKGDSLKGIPNLCYREGGRLTRNPLYPLIEKLDDLPLCEPIAANGFVQTGEGRIHRLDAKLLKRYGRHRGKLYDITTSRGCPFCCTYCCNNALSELYGSRRVRERSLGNAIRELEEAIEKHPDLEMVNFQDDTFMSHDEDFLREFCEEYRRRVGKPFIIRAIPTYVTRDKLRSLKEAGMVWITMGLQSGSDHVCKEIYRRTSVKKDFLRAAEMIKGFGLAALYDVILDNPLERDQDRLETVNALIETPKPFVVQFFSLTLYHGTELYDRVKRECPEMMQDAREKDCLQYERTPLNALTRLAAFLPEKAMRKILKLYRREPGSMWFKAVFTVAKMLNTFLFEPLACFMVLKRSERGSYRGAFGKIHVYLKELWSRYCRQFRRARSGAPEERSH